jgi:hypothetical protein
LSACSLLAAAGGKRETRAAIVNFVEAASNKGDGHLDPAERIAVSPVQLDFIFRALAAAAQAGFLACRAGAL